MKKQKDSYSIPLTMENIDLEYKMFTGKRVVFKNLNLKVLKGEKIGILGRSGIGKTSLLNLILREIDPTNGFLVVNEKPKIIGQFPILNPWLTCKEQIFLSLNKPIKVDEYLKEVGLIKQKDQLISTLSLGEKQRLALLSVIISEVNFILADEPFSRLDSTNAKKLINLFHEKLNSTNYTLIMTSHNLNHFKDFTKTYEIHNYKLKEIGTNSDN